jgi:enediyne biosynthesis protein E4
VDIFWPGGVKNRLYNVASSERLTIPEVPCDYAATWPSRKEFRNCVVGATNDLFMKGAIDNTMKQRLQSSALTAYDASH